MVGDEEDHKQERDRVKTLKGRLERRNLLKVAGVSSGMVMGIRRSTHRVSGERDRSHVANAGFIELGLKYEGAPEAPRGYICGMGHYVTNEEDDKITFIQEMPESLKKKFSDNEKIIRNNGNYHSVPGRLYNELRENVPVKFGASLNHAQIFILTKEHKVPKIETNESSGMEIKLEATNNNGESEEFSVPPQDELRIELPKETVYYEGSGEVKEVPDPRKPGDTTLIRTNRKMKETELTPVIKVKNYGVNDIYEKERE